MINRWSRAFKQKKGLRTRHRPRRFDARAALSRCSLSQQSVTTKSGLTSAPVAHVLSHAATCSRMCFAYLCHVPLQAASREGSLIDLACAMVTRLFGTYRIDVCFFVHYDRSI